jgi:hypothetical protein
LNPFIERSVIGATLGDFRSLIAHKGLAAECPRGIDDRIGGGALLPRNLGAVDFSVSPVNQRPMNAPREGGFLATQRNAVLNGGTRTVKSLLAIAIGANCVCNDARLSCPISSRCVCSIVGGRQRDR